MFDYAAPKHFEATSKQRGVGEHPHRGFETITVAFQVKEALSTAISILAPA